ncbi:MAG TPA: YebC/PmpR family DNA-binding transcriptional regulator, partial [Chroococcales cyanobacterium]
MSGHSKWSTIKRQKAKTDAARGAIFTKVSREIILAAQSGGGDPEGNFRLRTAIDKAKSEGVPLDNIKRAIQKGVGGGEDSNLEEIRYEGYGPGGVAVLVEAVTDNRNRTAADIRSAFSKNGGNLGETGCVGWMFAEKGQIFLSNEEDSLSEDDLMLAALDAGADDVRNQGASFEVLTEPSQLEAVQLALTKLGFPVESADLA